MQDTRKCARCKVDRPIKYFSLNRRDQYKKNCDECLIKLKIFRKKYKCKHGRQKATCKEGDCRGSSICSHGRQKATCKEGDCRGSSICSHGIIKAQCKEGDCSGSSICSHGRQKAQCKEGDCRGSSICSHGRIKAQCKKGDCIGSAFCPHGRIKAQCKNPVCGNDPIKITIRNWIKNTRQGDKKYNRYDPVKFIDRDFCRGLVEDNLNCYWCNCELQYIEHNNNLGTIERLNNKLGHNKDNCTIACLKCNCKRLSNKNK